MAKLAVPAGTTSKRVAIFIQDSSSTTGAGLTGLVFNSSGLTCYQWIDTDGNAGGSALTLATATLGTFTSSGFKEKDATNMPGWYEFGVPNAAIAAGVKWACFHFKGATNMAPLPIEIEVTAVNNQDGVHFGLTGIPNAAAGASGGLLISGSNSGTTTLGALTCTGSFTISDGLLVSRSSSNTSAITATGNGTGSGIVATSGSGATGDGIQATAASTNGIGLNALGTGTGDGIKGLGGNTSGNGLNVRGAGTGSGIQAQSGAGATGAAISAQALSTNGSAIRLVNTGSSPGLDVAGAGTGAGIRITTAAGDGIQCTPTAGHALVLTGNGTSKHGALLTGGTAGTSDGLSAVAGTGGVPIRGDITGNITGTLTTVTTATTATNLTNAPTNGDFTATMKTSIGTAVAASAVASVTARVTANTDQLAGQTVTAAAGVTFPTSVASPTNITAGTITTATNLTTNNDKTGYALTAGERTSVADALLDRDMSTGADSGSSSVRTVRQALRFNRNKFVISGGNLTVYKEDDATSSWTGTVSTTAGNPVTTIDPA